jgi:hypothetical protein
VPEKECLIFPVAHLLPCAKCSPPDRGLSVDGYYTNIRMYRANTKQCDIILHSTARKTGTFYLDVVE